MITLNKNNLWKYILCWILITVVIYYEKSSLFKIPFLFILFLQAIKETLKLINAIRFKQLNLTTVTIPFCAIIFLTLSVCSNLSDRLIFKIDFLLLKSKREQIVKDYISGKIKPNVEGSTGLYEIPFTVPKLSIWNNYIALNSNEKKEVRVTFYLDYPEIGEHTPVLVYSNDSLFNQKVEHLITVDKKSNEKLSENWYRINYFPRL